MKQKTLIIAPLAWILGILAGCGGAQNQTARLDVRPLEENKALDIIKDVLAERGYTPRPETVVALPTQTSFPCDFTAEGHPIGIEFLTEKDRTSLGVIPEAAPGSRLHVLSARTVATDQNPKNEPMYVFFIDDRKFVYQYNPTSEQRADVTVLEIDSRLRRDLADFLSWYENSPIKR